VVNEWHGAGHWRADSRAFSHNECAFSAGLHVRKRERVSVRRREGGRLSERKKLEIQRDSERFRGAPETLTQLARETERASEKW
jgi:hypothetical protein